MILLKHTVLEQQTLDYLLRCQREIDEEDDFPAKVAKAQIIWPLRSRNRHFVEVKAKLTAACAGAKRCCYCEDSRADSIDHFFPKSSYPENTFVWENYLYACSSCNRSKSNRFAVFHADTGVLTDFMSGRSTIPAPPPAGDKVLINPREEDPLIYLWLDLVESFHFTEVEDEPVTAAFRRSRYTIELLNLNSAELVQARKEAYGDYVARLEMYLLKKGEGTPIAELENMILGIRTKQHPTVWVEMKRQYPLIPALNSLFERVPEALDW